MATYSSDVTNPTPLTAREAVTIDSGATVTITSSAWSAAGSGNITLNNGRLLIQNTSTSSGIAVIMAGAYSNVYVNDGSVFETDGDWIELGTSDGTSGQTFTHWDATATKRNLPAVWVETSSGSGEYEPWVNAVGYSVSTMAGVGSGSFGRAFLNAYGSNTITFGDGTNGNIPPNGCKIRVPNIMFDFVGSNQYYASRNPEISAYTKAGKIILKNAIVNAYCRANLAILVDFDGVAFSGYPSFLKTSVSLKNSAFNPTGNSITSFTIQFYQNIVFENCIVNRSRFTFNTVEVVATDLYIYNTDKVASEAVSIYWIDIQAAGGSLSITRGALSGGYLKIRGQITLNDVDISAFTNNTTHSNTQTNVAYPCFYVLGDGALSLSNVDIHGDWPTLYRGDSAYPPTLSAWDNVNCNGSFLTNYIYISSISVGMTMRNVTYHEDMKVMSNFQGGTNLTVINNEHDSYASGDTIPTLYPLSSISIFKGFPADDVTTSTNYAYYDTFFAEIYTSATAGRLHLMFNGISTSTDVTFSGGAYSNYKGSLYLPTSGDSAEFVWPHTIIGFYEFVNSDPITNGTLLENIDMTFQYDIGSGWNGTWLDVTGVNLSSITLSGSTDTDKATNGVSLKFRFTANTSNTTTSINKFGVYMLRLPEVKYPADLVSITIRVIDSLTLLPLNSARVRLLRSLDDSLLLEGLTDIDGNISEDVEYSGDILIHGWVRRASSAPFFKTGNFSGTLNDGGFETVVQLIRDGD
jgi:hypothetical protein